MLLRMWNNNYIIFPTVRIMHYLESYAFLFLCFYFLEYQILDQSHFCRILSFVKSISNDLKYQIYYFILQAKSFPGALANKALAVVEALEGKVSIVIFETIRF